MGRVIKAGPEADFAIMAGGMAGVALCWRVPAAFYERAGDVPAVGDCLKDMVQLLHDALSLGGHLCEMLESGVTCGLGDACATADEISRLGPGVVPSAYGKHCDTFHVFSISAPVMDDGDSVLKRVREREKWVVRVFEETLRSRFLRKYLERFALDDALVLGACIASRDSLWSLGSVERGKQVRAIAEIANRCEDVAATYRKTLVRSLQGWTGPGGHLADCDPANASEHAIEEVMRSWVEPRRIYGCVERRLDPKPKPKSKPKQEPESGDRDLQP